MSNVLDYTNKFTNTYGSEIISKELLNRYGERYLNYRKQWKKASEGHLYDYPLNLCLDLINSCNLKCPQCLRSEEYEDEYGAFLKTKALLTPEFIKNLMEESTSYDLPSLNIGGGGECTTHPKFLEIVEIIMDSSVMELRIITNGLKLDDKISKGLIKLQVPILSVSIDANSSETFHLTRGKGDKYDLVIDNITKFLSIRDESKSIFPLLRVTFASQPNNQHERQDFINRWVKKADMVDIQSYCTWKVGDVAPDFFCPDPWIRMLFYAEGRISPCCGFTGLEYEVGRLEENRSVHELWHSKAMNFYRKMITTKSYQTPCLKCMASAKMYD